MKLKKYVIWDETRQEHTIILDEIGSRQENGRYFNGFQDEKG